MQTISFDLTHILLRVFSLSEVPPIWSYSWRRVFAEGGVEGAEGKRNTNEEGKKGGAREGWVKEGEESTLECRLFLFGILFWLISNTASATLCRRALKSPPVVQRRWRRGQQCGGLWMRIQRTKLTWSCTSDRNWRETGHVMCDPHIQYAIYQG